MGGILKRTAIVFLIGMWAATGGAEEITKEQIKVLDDQVQDIKKDVLDISAKLIQLEEKLVSPPNTQISIFLGIAQDEKFRLDAANIKIDGKAATHHIYTQGEMEALQHGGVQRIYTGNIRNGEHLLEVELIGKSTSNSDYRQSSSYKFIKEAGTKLIEITFAGPGMTNQGISFKD